MIEKAVASSLTRSAASGFGLTTWITWSKSKHYAEKAEVLDEMKDSKLQTLLSTTI